MALLSNITRKHSLSSYNKPVTHKGKRVRNNKLFLSADCHSDYWIRRKSIFRMKSPHEKLSVQFYNDECKCSTTIINRKSISITLTGNQITNNRNIWDLIFATAKSGNTNRYHPTCLCRRPPYTHVCHYSYPLSVVLGLYRYNSSGS